MCRRNPVKGAEFEVCGADTCYLCSLYDRCRCLKVPSAVFSNEGKKYRIIGISPNIVLSDANTISFDESSEVEEVDVAFITRISSIFSLPPRIKRVRCSDYELRENCPKIVCVKGCNSFVSTAGSRVIMNHFPLDVAYQQSFKQSFIIRETTRFVGNGSFSCNYKIRAVVFPSSVEYIGDSSFFHCSSLRFIHFKRNSMLKKIGNRSFMRSGVKRLSIPSSVIEIGKRSFLDCYNLRSVTFSEDSKLKTIGESSFSSSNIESINIPANVDKIGKGTFSDCKNLLSITFSEGSKLKTIRHGSFDSSSIKSINIPASVEEIGNNSFHKCHNLKSVTFPKYSKLKTIGNASFCESSIESIDIPSSVEEIGDNALCSCYDLRSVTFSEDSKLKTIGFASFKSSGIESIDIPSSVEEIGDHSFGNCKNLRSVEYQGKSHRSEIRNKFGMNIFDECPLLRDS